MTGRTAQAKAIFLSVMMVLSVVAIGAAGFAGSAAAAPVSNGDVTVDIAGGSTDLRAGSSAQSLGLIEINPTSAGELGSRTIVDLPDGVTVNETATDEILVDSTGGSGLSAFEVSIQNNGQTIRVDHDGSAEANEILRIAELKVDVAADANAAVDGGSNNVDVDFFTGDGTSQSSVINIYKAGVDTEAQTTIAAGASGTDFGGNITVSTHTVNDQIANQSNIVIKANESQGITFNTDVDPTQLSTDLSDKVDMSSATLTSTELTIPVTGAFSAGDTLQIDADNDDEDTTALKLDATTDASDARLTAEVTANESTGTIAADVSSNEDILVNKPAIEFNEDGTSGNNADLIPGKSGQTVANTPFNVTSNSPGDLASGSQINITAPTDAGFEFDTRNEFVITDGVNDEIDVTEDDGTNNYTASVIDDGGVADGDRLTGDELATELQSALNADADLSGSYTVTYDSDANEFTFGSDVGSGNVIFFNSAPNTDANIANTVGFSTNADLSAGDQTSDQTIVNPAVASTPAASTLSDTDVVVSSVTAEQITIDVGADSAAGDEVDVTGVAFNVSTDANATAYQKFGGEYANSITSSTSTGVQASATPKAYFNADTGDSPGASNATFWVDNDGVTGATGYTGGTMDINVESLIAGDVADGTYVNITLPADSGVTFDTRTNPNIAVSDYNTTGASADVSERKISVVVDDGPSGLNEHLEIDSVAYNVSAGSAGEEYPLTVETSPEAGVTYTQETDNVIKVKQATPETITVFENTPGSTVVNEKAEYEVKVTNDSLVDGDAGDDNFGNIDINYTATSTPDGGSFSVSDATSTGADGVAKANFTLDTTEQYDIQANPVGYPNVNATGQITPSSGEPAQLGITTVKNGFTEGTYSGTPADNEARAIVTVEDGGGNNVTDAGVVNNLDVFLTVGGNAQIVEVGDDDFSADDAGTNGDGSYDVEGGDPGKLYVTYKDTSAETVDLDASEVNDDVSAADTQQLSFFNAVTTVDVSTNVSELAVGDAAQVTYTVSNNDGAIDVSGLSVNAGVSNGTVGSVAANGLTTDGSGQATTTFTAEENGTTSLTGISKSKQGSASITVTPDAASEPATDQVALENVNLDPDTVSNGTTNAHTLTFDATNVSDDDSTDTFTIEFPSVATLNGLDAASVTDADGNEVTIEDSAVSGNTITVDVSPNSSVDTRDLSVSADVNVTAPDVTEDATANINIDVADSANGQDNAAATLTVEAVAPGTVPAEVSDDVTAQQWSTIVGDDNDPQATELSAALRSWADTGTYDGVDYEATDLSAIIRYWANQ